MPEPPTTMHRGQFAGVYSLVSEHGLSVDTAVCTAASVWNSTSKMGNQLRRVLQRVRDQRRRQLRPSDALVYGALLRFKVNEGRPGSCLLRRLPFPDERRVQ